jgi:cbb3-type cytochrome oxidase cytochrome c subunit
LEAKIKEIEKKEIIAMIAYLQRMGTDIKVKVPNK